MGFHVLKAIGCLATLLVFALGFLLFDRKPDEWAEESARRDQHITNILNHGEVAVAKSWLLVPNHMLLEADPALTNEFVDELYEIGAANTWFTGLQSMGRMLVAQSIVVQLPDDWETRNLILRKEALFFDLPEPNRDVGQKYIEFHFD